jgi:hypothetical protein
LRTATILLEDPRIVTTSSQFHFFSAHFFTLFLKKKHFLALAHIWFSLDSNETQHTATPFLKGKVVTNSMTPEYVKIMIKTVYGAISG